MLSFCSLLAESECAPTAKFWSRGLEMKLPRGRFVYCVDMGRLGELRS